MENFALIYVSFHTESAAFPSLFYIEKNRINADNEDRHFFVEIKKNHTQ